MGVRRDGCSMTEVIRDPCFRCHHRDESKRRVREFLAGVDARSGALVNDIAPKAECKRHAGYGIDPEETRLVCRDFTENYTDKGA